jgi:hypothetical protein
MNPIQRCLERIKPGHGHHVGGSAKQVRMPAHFRHRRTKTTRRRYIARIRPDPALAAQPLNEVSPTPSGGAVGATDRRHRS